MKSQILFATNTLSSFPWSASLTSFCFCSICQTSKYLWPYICYSIKWKLFSSELVQLEILTKVFPHVLVNKNALYVYIPFPTQNMKSHGFNKISNGYFTKIFLSDTGFFFLTASTIKTTGNLCPNLMWLRHSSFAFPLLHFKHHYK